MKTQNPLLKLCFALFLCFTLASCKDDKPEAVITGPFPFLKIGNEWNYEHKTVAYYDGEIKTRDEYTATLRIESVSFDSVNNLYDYTLYNAKSGVDYIDKSHYVCDIRDTSLWIDSNNKLLYWNCYLGQKWIAWQDGNVNYNAEVVSMSEVIETSAGFFDCIKVKINKDIEYEEYTTWWISRKYGIMKVETYMDSDSGGITGTLSLTSKNF